MKISEIYEGLFDGLSHRKEKELLSFVRGHHIKRFDFKNGVLDLPNDVYLKDRRIAKIPFKLGKVDNIYFEMENLKTFENFPSEVTDSIEIANAKIESLDGLNMTVGDKITFNFISLKTLKDVHKHIPKAKRISFSKVGVESNVLGLCLIEGLEDLTLSSSCKYEFHQACDIIRNYLNQGRKGMLAAQRELLDCEDDLEAYAQL